MGKSPEEGKEGGNILGCQRQLDARLLDVRLGLDTLMSPPPRTACLTRATVRRVKTACAQPCPPMCVPVLPKACCSVAGGTASAVSVLWANWALFFYRPGKPPSA